MDLFQMMNDKQMEKQAPLAERMKPRTLSEFTGQEHIIGEGKLLTRMIEADRLTSILLFGPPGSGKTSLARVIANTTSARFTSLNAVTSGIKDIREAVEEAKQTQGMYGKRTILFIDEIHRFNKTQQDALLPYVENGTVLLIGATTENPYYEINNALISRSTVFRLKDLTPENIQEILHRTLKDPERGLGMLSIELSEDAELFISNRVGGDARKALNALEIASLTTPMTEGTIRIDLEILKNSMQQSGYGYDKDGDSHYDLASAFIKSMRGSDPDAALHYMARMIHGGEDPTFIARRIIIAASEDVGNADPQALQIAVSAAQAIEMIGMPEGRIVLAQAATYVACAPKSNAAYNGIDDALDDVRRGELGPMPLYLKDGTSLSMMKKNEKVEAEAYKYPHAYEKGYVEQQYLPDRLAERIYYTPKASGYERQIRHHLETLGAAKGKG